MESPLEVVQRVCRERHASPDRILARLLRMLSDHHRTFVQSATSTEPAAANVFSEIMAHLRSWNPPKEIPVSLLATLESMAGVDHHLSILHTDRTAADSDREVPDPAMADRRADDRETLRLILKDMMNITERQGAAQNE